MRRLIGSVSPGRARPSIAYLPGIRDAASPAIIETVVVLPAPLGPSSPTSQPARRGARRRSLLPGLRGSPKIVNLQHYLRQRYQRLRISLHGFRNLADCILMTCENCGAPMRLSRDQGLMICDYCCSQTTPPTDEEGVLVIDPSSHNCPICQVPLANASLESCDLLYCERCHGMLLNMEKLVSLLETRREHPSLVQKLAKSARR